MWLLYISCAWVAGIFLGSKASLPAILILSGIIPFLLIPLFSNSRKLLIVAGLCLLAFFGGYLCYPSSPPQIDEHCLCFYNDKEPVQIQGLISDEPDIRGKFCFLTFSASEINIEGIKKEVSGTALLRVPRYPALRYGDILQVTGELETPVPFNDFDYKSYLARQGIHSIIYYPEIDVIDSGNGLKPLQWLYSLRENLSNSLDRALPEPQGSLAQGILLGMRANIPDSLNQSFSRTGTAHLLAISGLHIGIVIAIVLSFGILIFGRQRSIYIWLALIVTWLYVLLTGMRPPVIRAAIMGSLFLLAEFLGRQRDAITALAFAAAVMVGIQPYILWSISFQLSFLAMAGLILLYPYFQWQGRKGVTDLSRNSKAIASIGNMVTDSFSVTLAAIIATWPLIAYNFHIISLVALPATFFSLLSLPAIITSSALVALVGLFAPLIAQILGWLAWLFLSYLLLVIQVFDTLPHSSLPVAAIPVWQVWVYYAGLAVAIAILNHRKKSSNLLPKLSAESK